MQRLTISLSDELAQAFDEWMTRRGYSSRSEAVRDMLRRELGEDNLASEQGGPAWRCSAMCLIITSGSCPPG
jgi:CopG family nickel-responsive transcriptional regulator